MNNTLPPRNHNSPPSDIEYLGENLTLRHIALLRQAEEHIEFVKQIPGEFHVQAEADFTSDFIKKVQTCFKSLEKARAEEKEPFLRQGQFVDTFFGDMKKKLQRVENKAIAPLNLWLQEKAREERALREAEAMMLRKEQEAAMREAAQSSSKPAQEAIVIIDHAITMSEVAKVADIAAAAPLESMSAAQGKFSAAGLKKVWRGEIRNAADLDMQKLKPYFTLPELQKALDRFVKAGGRQCEGAVIIESMEAKVK